MKRQAISLLSTFCLLAGVLPFVSPLPAQEEKPASPLVYVIPVKTDIDASIVYVIRRGVKEAIENKADILILDMDTNGGRVDKTEEIIGILNKFEPRADTYTYVNTKAFSAGSFIAAATRHIYMNPSGVIGAAAPIMMTPGSAPEALPESVEEKFVSAVRGLVRAQAEQNGHNPAVFDAMVDRSQGLVVAGKEILPKGKLLTLTSKEASTSYGTPPVPLLSQGTMASLDELITKVAGTDAQIVKVEPTGWEQISHFLVSISPLLIAGALLMGYIEFKTPGFGIFGIGAIVCGLLFFFGHYIAGLSGYEFALLFLVGIALIALELFLVPGTILPALLGATIIVGSLLLAMVDHFPGGPVIPTLEQLEGPLTTLGCSLIITLLGFWILVRTLPKTFLYTDLVLQQGTVPSGAGVGHSADTLVVGTEGRALTPLRPSGTAEFGSGPVDVLTEGDFLPKGQTIRVARTEGNRVFVEPLS